MWGLGQSPILFPQLGFIIPSGVLRFGQAELEMMQTLIDETDADDHARMVAGMTATVNRLKREDSVNAKLGLYAIARMKGTLSDQAAQYDIDFPATAPHTVLLGPRFPRDSRDIPIAGRIATIGPNGVVDDRGLFADPYWSTVAPADRLSGHVLHMTTGLRQGDDILILDHRLKGAGAPSLTLEEAVDLAPGDRFKIPDITLPQDNLDGKDRSTDWVISTAIQDTFDAPNTSPMIRSAYWTAETNLKGRELLVAGAPYRITAHTLGVSIALDGAPVLGLVPFSIPAKSPFETGKQSVGTLRLNDGSTFGSLEPNTKIRLQPRGLSGNAAGVSIRADQQMIDRCLHLRFQKYFGSKPRLNRFRKTARKINRQWEQGQLRRDDILTVANDLNLPVSEE